MRFPYATAVFALALVACQKTATTNDSATIATDNAAAINSTGTATTVDAAFVTDAMKGDNGEVAIGQLAAANASSQKAKDFGKMLATDHGAHKAKLAAMASSAGVAVADDMTAEGKANLDKLKALHGAAFDTAFKTAMIDDHTKDIAKYEKQAAGPSSESAALARDTLPTLHKHLDAAKAL